MVSRGIEECCAFEEEKKSQPIPQVHAVLSVARVPIIVSRGFASDIITYYQFSQKYDQGYRICQ